MPNFQRGRYNIPLTFFIRPDGLGTQHNVRVKVNADYNVGYDRIANFSIQFLPATGVASGHNTGSVQQSDIDGMIRWLDSHRTTFIDYFTGVITAQQFDAALTACPYP